jgi:hypothetical protein
VTEPGATQGVADVDRGIQTTLHPGQTAREAVQPGCALDPFDGGDAEGTETPPGGLRRASRGAFRGSPALRGALGLGNLQGLGDAREEGPRSGSVGSVVPGGLRGPTPGWRG